MADPYLDALLRNFGQMPNYMTPGVLNATPPVPPPPPAPLPPPEKTVMDTILSAIAATGGQGMNGGMPSAAPMIPSPDPRIVANAPPIQFGSATPAPPPANYTNQLNFGPPAPPATPAPAAPSGPPAGLTWRPPVAGPVTSGFGPRSAPVPGASSNHLAMDYGVPIGTPVGAAVDGKVVFAGPRGGLGNVVIVESPGGYRSTYAHLANIGVNVGDMVGAGAPLGLSGRTGTVSGPNLHFAVTLNGQPIDPSAFFGGAAPQGQGQVQSTPGAPFSAPPVTYPDPRTLGALIPDPTPVPTIDLPDAPQAEMPAPRPQYVQLDRAAMMAELQNALKVDKRDQSGDKWDRIVAMLAAAASAAAAAGPEAGLGRTIGAAGGAAGGAFRTEKDRQEALNRDEGDKERQARIALAQFGFGIDDRNNTIVNRNLDQAWASSEDARTTRFNNASATDNRNVQEMLGNSDINRFNTGQQNETNRTRGTVIGQGLQGQAAAANAAADRQNQLDIAKWQTEREDAIRAAAAGPQAQLDQRVGNMIAGVGITSGRTDPAAMVATEAASSIVSGNTAGAVNAFAKEVILNAPSDVRLFPPEIGLTKEEKERYQRAMNTNNPNEAAAIVAGALQRNPNLTGIIQSYAQRGNPAAILIMRNNQRQTSADAMRQDPSY